MKKVDVMDIVKMKQGMTYSRKEKTIILNVFKYFKFTYPDACVTEIVTRTSNATGCSAKSIFQFRKEDSSAEGFKQPSKRKIRKNININSRSIKYDNNVRQALRNIIYDLKGRQIVPSLGRVVKIVNNDEKLPNFSLMTLRRLLFDMGFCYERDNSGSKPVLVEKQVQDNYKKVDKQNKNKKLEICKQVNLTNSAPATKESTTDLTNAYPPLQTTNTLMSQQNQLYITNQSPHEIVPVSLPPTENHMNDHYQMAHSFIMNVLPPQLHSLPNNFNHFNYTSMHSGLIHTENALLPQ